MADEQSRKITYIVPVILAAWIGIFLYFWGDAPSLIFMKLTAVPLYLLAGRAVSLLFPLPSGKPLNRAFWERQFLDSVLIACCLTIALWQPGKGLAETALGFSVMIVVYVGFMFLARVFLGGSREQKS
jgi:hypothetical protein